ncbi:MAG: DJ-1/PfpI family protein [Clostridia bacterium]|nr:DJ-1/PfpI family protein [Clostridia bacterium]
MDTYIFLADGFEEVEALCPWDLLLRAGVPVKLVSINADENVTGTHGLKVRADVTAASLGEPKGKICVVLPGGMPGAANLDADPVVDKYVAHAAKHGHLGAICAAPFILGKRGILSGKEATCYPGFEGQLEGARLSAKKTVTCRNVTTSRGMGLAYRFGIELVSEICGKDAARKVCRATQHRTFAGLKKTRTV